MPTTEGINFILSILFYSILKIWFIFLFIKLGEKTNPNHKYLSILVVFILSFLIEIDIIIIGISFLQCLLYIEKSKLINLSFAVFIAFIGFSIKTSIGISAFSIIFMTFLIDVYFKKSIFKAIKFISVSLLIILFLGFLLFSNFKLFYNYCISAFNLSMGYSNSLSLHPSNNWFLLSGFLSTFLLIPIFFKNKELKISFLLLLPTLFAMWKHGMTREDISHISLLLFFLFLFWGILIICSEFNFIKLFFLSTISILLFYSNINNLPNFNGFKIEICGINNFWKTVVKYKNFKNKYIIVSNYNIQNNKLDENVIKTIGNSSIDTYPWELTYIPANKLNWKPRQALQGVSFSRWYDNINAQDFEWQRGPEFVLFHFVKDSWGGDFGSIDNRYLLNDNPHTIFNILNNYSLKIKTEKYLLFQKNSIKNFSKTIIESKEFTSWNKWINVPNSKNELIRLKVFSETSIIGRIKNFLYKSEAYFIDYLMEDNNILTFRFIPENAKDGIWINPFIQFPYSDKIEPKTIKVRLRCTYPLFNKKLIGYQFEKNLIDTVQYSLNENLNSTNLLFFKKKFD